MEFSISTEISSNYQFEDIEESLRNLLKEQGFGILTEIDVQAVMKQKLDLSKKKYKILGACNPPLANKALDAEPEIGIFLPCNIAMYVTSTGSTKVSATNANTMFKMIDNEEIRPIANEVTKIFKEVIEKLDKKFN